MKKAKHHMNVISDILFDITLTNVNTHLVTTNVIFGFLGVYTWTPHLVRNL